ncbi:hypothetical protein lbkm_0143 [Lachnospiraceae bacterium KM106-2]|nr:hypothetical protein lbkm_0143 [Lachnospiraceae bacterium KM106-2]
MQNFQVVTEADKTWLQYELPKDENVDTYLLSILTDEEMKSIAKIRDEDKKEGTAIYYDITGLVPLSKYLQQVITVKQLCLLLKNTLESFNRMRDAMIETDKIYMNPKYIFISVINIQPKFICIPSVKSFRHFFLSDFLRHIIANAKLKGVTDPSVMHQITSYLGAREKFDSNTMLAYLNRILDMKEEEPVTFSLSGKLLTASSIQLAKPVEEVKKPQVPIAIPKKNPADSTIATITRLKTGEKISIVKPIFRIGKDKDSVDYQILQNSAISRCHAMIIARDDKFFIIDLHSTNHTYVNAQMIPTNQETEIFHGYRISLGNETFYFEVM